MKSWFVAALFVTAQGTPTGSAIGSNARWAGTFIKPASNQASVRVRSSPHWVSTVPAWSSAGSGPVGPPGAAISIQQHATYHWCACAAAPTAAYVVLPGGVIVSPPREHHSAVKATASGRAPPAKPPTFKGPRHLNHGGPAVRCYTVAQPGADQTPHNGTMRAYGRPGRLQLLPFSPGAARQIIIVLKSRWVAAAFGEPAFFWTRGLLSVRGCQSRRRRSDCLNSHRGGFDPPNCSKIGQSMGDGEDQLSRQWLRIVRCRVGYSRNDWKKRAMLFIDVEMGERSRSSTGILAKEYASQPAAARIGGIDMKNQKNGLRKTLSELSTVLPTRERRRE